MEIDLESVQLHEASRELAVSLSTPSLCFGKVLSPLLTRSCVHSAKGIRYQYNTSSAVLQTVQPRRK